MSAGEASSSSALRAIMDELEDRALRIEGVKAKTLSTDLGQWLLESGTSVDKLGHEWDRNGDGDITKAEFRVNMRKLPIAAKIDVAEIDALFDSLDTDHGGELDMGELKAALKKLLAEAKAFNKGTRQGNAKSAEVRSVKAKFEAALELTLAYEKLEKELDDERTGLSTAARLGAQLKLRNIKIGQVVQGWDKDGSGSLDAKEFRANVYALGFKAKDWEVDEVFYGMDDDGSGEYQQQQHSTSARPLTLTLLSFRTQVSSTPKS